MLLGEAAPPSGESYVTRTYDETQFLGFFEKLRNATVSFVMSVCLRLTAWNNTGFTRRISTKFVFFCLEICRENSAFIKIWRE